MPGVGGVIENRDAELFAIDLAGVIDPARAMSPDLRLTMAAFGIDHQAGSLGSGERLLVGLLQLRCEANRKRAFLGIAESHFLNGRERDVEVDDAARRFGVKRHAARLGQQDFPMWVHPVEAGVNHAGLFAAGDLSDAFEHDLGILAAVLRRLVAPEIEPVDVAVTEPEAAMVGMVVSLAGHVLHWIAARYYLARCRAQGVKIGLGGVGSAKQSSERLAVNRDR